MRILAAMPNSMKSDEEAGVLFVRQFPKGLLAKLKAAAVLNGKTLSRYMEELCEAHVEELERKGQLPKSK